MSSPKIEEFKEWFLQLDSHDRELVAQLTGFLVELPATDQKSASVYSQAFVQASVKYSQHQRKRGETDFRNDGYFAGPAPKAMTNICQSCGRPL
jgi:hypothetical protein